VTLADAYTPGSDNTTPAFEVYRRGAYFQASTLLTFDGLLLNYAFTLNVWLRYDQSTASLLQITDTATGDNVFNLQISANQLAVTFGTRP
jgi:hypothetical protein